MRRMLRVSRVFALALALLLPLAAVAPAHAAPALDPDADTELVITLLQQPAALGDAADGAPLDESTLAAMTPIAGATFEARLVPGIDLTTNDGQRAASAITVADAAAMGPDGVARLGGVNGRLGVGLYLVQQTDATARGRGIRTLPRRAAAHGSRG